MKILAPLIAAAALSFGASPGFAQDPINDNFADRVELTGVPVTAFGENLNATKEAGEPNHGLNLGGGSVWWTWTAPTAGIFEIDLRASAFDTLLGIYTGNAVDDLIPLAFNDDASVVPQVVQSRALVSLKAGETIHIAADGFGDGTAFANGDIQLDIRLGPAGPSNDNFASAIDLGSVLGITVNGNNVNATREIGEPEPFAPQYEDASVWWKWTAPSTMDVIVDTEGSALSGGLVGGANTLLSVYSGADLNSLRLVERNNNANANVSHSEVKFVAEAGVTYFLRVGGPFVQLIDGSGGLVGTAVLTGAIQLSINQDPERSIVAFGSEWEYLHPLDGVDPALADTDFETTWHTPAAYDGPAFVDPLPAILGYGAINFDTITTDIIQPDSGLRYSAYFRHTFTLAEDEEALGIEILADDGAVIYIDGVEVARTNFTGADTYLAFADGSAGREDTLNRLAIPDLAAGEHTIAVSLHNAANDSSDLGFDLRLFAGSPDFGVTPIGVNGVGTGFEEPAPGARLYERPVGGLELSWAIDGAGGAVADFAGQGALEFNGVAGTFRSERIDVRGASGLVASIDLRVFQTSTGLESDDSLRAYIAGSADGTLLSEVAELIPLTTGGRELTPPNDQLILFDIGGGYTRFTTAPGAIPDGLAVIQVVFESSNNSGSEHFVIDNVLVTQGGPRADGDGDSLSDAEEIVLTNTNPGQADTDFDGQSDGAEINAGTDPNLRSSVFALTSTDDTGSGIALVWSAIDGWTYTVEVGDSLSPTGWTKAAEVLATGNLAGFTVPRALFIDGRGFARVRPGR